MRRILLSVVLAGLLASFGFYWFWTHAGRLPDPMEWVMLAPFAPGIGVAALANQLGMNDPDSGRAGALMFVGDTVFWTAVFYGLATVYVRRQTRRRNRA
jgi:hypothetical protein